MKYRTVVTLVHGEPVVFTGTNRNPEEMLQNAIKNDIKWVGMELSEDGSKVIFQLAHLVAIVTSVVAT